VVASDHGQPWRSSLYTLARGRAGTLLSQARKGRLAELQARAALDAQRASENERLESTVAQRTEALGQSLQARRQLLGRISHDLRAPLAAIVDSARQWRAGDSRRDYPDLIERNANRQMELIDELLEFSGTEQAATELAPVPGYLYTALYEVAETVELATERHGNCLHCHFAPDLPAVVQADFRSLRRVLTNLLGNADKYTRRGDIHFSVERRLADTVDVARLHFRVDDNGPGMSAAERERLLQPFTRGANISHVKGSGLGLAIVTTLLEHMGSELEIDASSEGGSRFQFELTLPLAQESDLDPLLEDDGAMAIDGRGYTIVIVDDDEQQRELTSDLLNGYGFDTIAAADGRETLDRMQRQTVDLVVTDQIMAGVGGWGLLQAIRQQQPELPVILYSGLPPLRPVELDAAIAFDTTLLKPAHGTTLLRQIVRVLGRSADQYEVAAPGVVSATVA